jgi:hypothetical protein
MLTAWQSRASEAVSRRQSMSSPERIYRAPGSSWNGSLFLALATGFLGLIIVSATAGIFVILNAIP